MYLLLFYFGNLWCTLPGGRRRQLVAQRGTRPRAQASPGGNFTSAAGTARFLEMLRAAKLTEQKQLALFFAM